MHYFQGDFLVL